MKKLDRKNPPSCLSKFKSGRDNWSVISQNGLTESIWIALEEMQGDYCAYCECSLQERKKHIEHFFRRSQHPGKIFEWENLFGSCNSRNSCGKFKDEDKEAKGIDLAKVCKPDNRDASELILFLSSGRVKPITSLTTLDQEIAENTIQVFNLNDTTLVNFRRLAICSEKESADFYWQMKSEDDNELTELLDQELSEALDRIKEGCEYSTALKHLWTDHEEY